MKTTVPEQSQKTSMPHFEQSKTEPIAVVARKTWWDKNEYRVGGLMRVVSRGALILSGLGVGKDVKASPLRATSGVLGMLAGVYISAYGAKATDNPAKAQETLEEKKKRADTIGRKYYGIIAVSGAAMLASGLLSKSKDSLWETLAGLWTMVWAAYATFMPEGKKAPVFDPGATRVEKQGIVNKDSMHRQLEEYRRYPKKLASDMLQFSALLATADGIKREDPWRIVSGITLGASNYMHRHMRDADFVPGPQGPAL